MLKAMNSFLDFYKVYDIELNALKCTDLRLVPAMMTGDRQTDRCRGGEPASGWMSVWVDD